MIIAEAQPILTHVMQEYPMVQPINDIYKNLKESEVVIISLYVHEFECI